MAEECFKLEDSFEKFVFKVDLNEMKYKHSSCASFLTLFKRTVTTVKQLTERYIKIGAFLTVTNNSQVVQLTAYFGKA